MTTKLTIQDVGDGEGLDLLNADGDLLLSGQSEAEIARWLEVNAAPTDAVTVSQGALGREVDDDALTVEEVLDELSA